MSDEESFVLRNDSPQTPPVRFDGNGQCRQTKLFAGLDCLAGQRDLFDCDCQADEKIPPASA